MNTTLILDEAWIFLNRLNPARTLIKEGKPTLALVLQDIHNTKRIKPLILKKNMRHNQKVARAINTDIMRYLRKEYGNFTLKNNLAEFENIRYILTDEVFTKILIKKRNVGKRKGY